MNANREVSSPQRAEDAREIGKWARTYAQNRTLGVLVSLTVFLALFLAIAASSYLGGQAYRSGNAAILWASIALMASAMAGLLFFAVPRWGGKWVERMTERLYVGEGSARLEAPRTRSRRWLMGLAAATFAVCILAQIAIRQKYGIPEQYVQPISAIYCVPFLVAIWLVQRPAVGPLALLWPALYALHAVLILAGVPILFDGRWQDLNMLIPTAGYGLLAGLIAHAYSRFALRRLRRTARASLQDETAEEPQP
jgi:hypothetical protein